MKFSLALVVGLIGLGAAFVLNRFKLESDEVHPWPPQDKMEVPQDTLVSLCFSLSRHNSVASRAYDSPVTLLTLATQGPDGFTKQWTNAQGYKIFSVFYPTTVKKPKGILLLLHGHGVHVIFEFMKSSGVGVERKYDKSWIQELNKQGYSCCGMDVQSKGRSEGYKQMRTYFDSFDDVIKDDLDFISKLPELGGEAFTDLPIFPFAVSMGGARAAMLLIRNESLFKAALLYAPMLSLERVSKQGLNPYLRPLVSMFNILGPTWRMAKASKNTMFPDLQDEFSSDFFSDQGMYVCVQTSFNISPSLSLLVLITTPVL